MLRELGYVVLEVGSGGAALDFFVPLRRCNRRHDVGKSRHFEYAQGTGHLFKPISISRPRPANTRNTASKIPPPADRE
jgi:hypothetical protein